METVSPLYMERTFAASAERVFEAWTSEEVLRRWHHGARGWETPEASVDLRVGGAVRVVMRDPENGAEYGGGGVYTVIEPPRRLAFTWLWDDRPEYETTIAISFEEVDGGTLVRFTHAGLPDLEQVRSHEGGWGAAFDELEDELAAGGAS
jgi:uncharacterized protein YndB with AHSA1/START domain